MKLQKKSNLFTIMILTFAILLSLSVLIFRLSNPPRQRQSSYNPQNPGIGKIKTKSPLTKTQALLVKGASSRINDRYDASYQSCGTPLPGRSACVDVVYFAYKNIGTDIQKELNIDLNANPGLYPDKGDCAINHRRCPNLIVWFQRNTKSLTTDTSKARLKEWQPGDVVFWSLAADGTADHVGIISDEITEDGYPLVIHQFPPICKTEDVLDRWKVVGHFRNK